MCSIITEIIHLDTYWGDFLVSFCLFVFSSVFVFFLLICNRFALVWHATKDPLGLDSDFGTSPRWGKEPDRVQEVKGYQTLFCFGVFQCERLWAGVSLRITPQLSGYVLESLRVNERVTSMRLWVGDRSTVLAYKPNSSAVYKLLGPWEEYCSVLQSFYWETLTPRSSESIIWRAVIRSDGLPLAEPSWVGICCWLLWYSQFFHNWHHVQA